MSGLMLRGGFSGGGGYTPMTVAAAGSPTSNTGAPPSIAQQAFGIQADSNGQRGTAGYGSVGVGIVALAAMVYLWWSLPR